MSKTAERTHPELWEEVKAEVRESEKGGKAGEWSARKAQLAVREYKKRGGGYRGGKSDNDALKQWNKEEWATKSGNASSEAGEHYLPKSARQTPSDEDYHATTGKKREESRKGEQFSRQPQPVAAKTALYRHAGRSEPAAEPSKADLLQQAKMLEIDRRSRMSKEELVKAIRYAKH